MIVLIYKLCFFSILTFFISNITLADEGQNAGCTPSFSQVNIDGFGDRFNIYAWSMKVFNDLLYVGTLNMQNGAEIWRFDGENWERVIANGFGDQANIGIRNLTIFNNQIYAGVMNEVEGASIWRSSDGSSWELMVNGGLGDAGNVAVRGMTTYLRRLFIGLQNNSGSTGELWRSNLTGSAWIPVAVQGFGFPNNSSIHSLERYAGLLYVGTRNVTSGAQLWRSADGVNFQQIVGPNADIASGFGNANNGVIYDIKRFNGMLFIGIGNVNDGFSIFRSSNGVTFDMVGDIGFGDPENVYAWRFFEYEDHLWLGVTNINLIQKGGSLWRSDDGTNWEEMIGANGSYMSYGFNDSVNWGVRSFEKFNEKLYIGTAQCWFENCANFVTGTEVWEWTGENCL